MKRTSDPSHYSVEFMEPAKSAAGAHRGAWGRLWRDRRGAITVIVAVSLPILLAFAGLAVNVGWWYTIKRQNQLAADAAALSAAYEVLADQLQSPPVTPSLTDLTAWAQEAAATQNHYGGVALTGVSAAGTPATCTDPGVSYLCYVYSDTIATSGVEVLLRQAQNSWFALFGSLPSVTIANRAVAVVQTPVNPNPCLLALSPTGTSVYLQGAASVSTPTCTIVADSTSLSAVNLHDSGDTLTAANLYTRGGIAVGGTPVDPPGPLPSEFTVTSAFTGQPNVPDPYASTLTHTLLTTGIASGTCPQGQTCTSMPTTCTPQPGSGTTVYNTNPPNSPNLRFCAGLTIKNKTVDLQPTATQPLTIWITDGDLQFGPGGGTLSCSTCSVTTGAGVAIILTTGCGSQPTPTTCIVGGVTMQGTASMSSLNAPGSGPFEGLLLIQDSNDLPAGTTFTQDTCNGPTGLAAPCYQFEGNPGNTLNGLVYFPDTNLEFQGNPTVGSDSCLQVVVNQAALVGSSSLATSGCANEFPGGPAPPSVKTVFLAE